MDQALTILGMFIRESLGKIQFIFLVYINLYFQKWPDIWCWCDHCEGVTQSIARSF